MTNEQKEAVLGDIDWQVSYFAACRDSQCGINSKDTVKMSRLINDARKLGASREEILRVFENHRLDGEFNYALAVRTEHLIG